MDDKIYVYEKGDNSLEIELSATSRDDDTYLLGTVTLSDLLSVLENMQSEQTQETVEPTNDAYTAFKEGRLTIKCETPVDSTALLERLHTKGFRWSVNESLQSTRMHNILNEVTVVYIESMGDGRLLWSETPELDVMDYTRFKDFIDPSNTFNFANFAQGDFVIRCDTRAKAQALMNYLSLKGINWRGLEDITTHDNWSDYKEDTTYRLRGTQLTYGRTRTFLNEVIQIINYENFIQD